MKLFVAKLPQNVTSESLKSLFETHGEVTEAKVIIDRETGMSKGYGFVEMATTEAGQNAISSLNGFELDGKDLLVKESDPTPENSGDKRSPTRPTGDRWDNQNRDHAANRRAAEKNLRPRRKRI